MPYLVEIRERDDLLSDAVLRLVRRGGVEAVTLSRVAAEAGVTMSCVRHSRATREELLTRTVVTVASRHAVIRREAGLRHWRRYRYRDRNREARDSSVADYLVEAELPTTPEALELLIGWLLLSSWPGLGARAQRCVEADRAEQLAVCALVVRNRASADCCSASERRGSPGRGTRSGCCDGPWPRWRR